MILEKVKEIISEQLGVPKEDITEQSSLVDDFGADSLDMVETIMAVEEDFEIEIPEDKLERIRTVSDIVEAVREEL
jgi:acyl carrier protein